MQQAPPVPQPLSQNPTLPVLTSPFLDGIEPQRYHLAIKVGFCSHYCFLCINDFEIVMCDFLYHFQDYVVDALTYQKNKKTWHGRCIDACCSFFKSGMQEHLAINSSNSCSFLLDQISMLIKLSVYNQLMDYIDINHGLISHDVILLYLLFLSHHSQRFRSSCLLKHEFDIQCLQKWIQFLVSLNLDINISFKS